MSSVLSGNISRIHLSEFYNHLALMLKSGIPITKALESLSAQEERGEFRAVITAVKMDITAGKSLSQSITPYNPIFSDTDIQAIKMGESSGKLDEILFKLSEIGTRQYLEKQKIRNIMTYPLTVFILSSIILAVISQTIVASIYPLLADKGIGLGFAAKIIIGLSKTMQNPAGLAAALLVTSICIATAKKIIKTNDYRKKMQKILWNMPLVNKTIKTQAFCDFCRNFAFLYEHNTEIRQSLILAGQSTGNIMIQDTSVKLVEDLINGLSLSESFKKYFPKSVNIFVETGEKSGKLAECLNRLSAFYQQEINYTAESFAAMLEPFLMLFMGIVAGVIALSVLSPIYGAINTLGL